MISNGKLWRCWSGPSEGSVLSGYILGSWSQHDEDVHDARLKHPEGVHLLLSAGEPSLTSLLDIHPSLGSVEPEQSHAALGVVSHHEGDAGIQSHRVPQLILKHICDILK